MGKFTRIAESANPIEVLLSPMDIGLVPIQTDWATDWDANFEEATRSEGDGNYTEVEGELRDRFSFAHWLFDGTKKPDTISAGLSSVGSDPLIDAFQTHRKSENVRRLLAHAIIAKFPGLDVERAIEAHREASSYSNLCRKQKTQWDTLKWMLEDGYKPPFPPSELVAHGTKLASKGARTNRAIATVVARKVLSGELKSEAIHADLNFTSGQKPEPYLSTEALADIRAGKKLRVNEERVTSLGDRMARRSLQPWPEGLFDHEMRYTLFRLAGWQAFKEASLSYFVWSRVERLEPDFSVLELSDRRPTKRIVIKDRSEQHACRRKEQDKALAERMEDSAKMAEFRAGFMDDHRACDPFVGPLLDGKGASRRAAGDMR